MNAWVINPPFSKDMIKEGRCEQDVDLFGTLYPPLTMAEVAAILRKKYVVEVFDAIAEKLSVNYFKNKIKVDIPKCVFVNTSTQTFENDLNFSNILSKISKKTIFYLYGVHAKYFSKKVKTSKNIFLLNKMPYSKAFELTNSKYNSIDDIPIPAWDLINLKNYKIPIKNNHFTIIRTSFGCPYSCTFCTAPFYYGKKYQQKSLKNIMSEIEYSVSIGINEILFYSEIFTYNKEFVRKLCNYIISKNIKINWMCNSRVDTIDFTTLEMMKKAGCWLISYGIESFSQYEIDNSKKNINVEKSIHAIHLTNKAGILTLGHFILGLPGSTINSIKKSIKKSVKTGLDFALYYIATPFPGSNLYEESNIKNQNFLNTNYNSNIINKNINLKK